MRYLSLFSGAGGGDLAMQHLLGFECVGYVEWEEYPCQVLEARIRDGMLNDAPVWHCDIREFNERTAEQYRGVADLVTGGFPCQPFSVAGRQRGADDERNMWPAMCDTIGRIQPRYAFMENSANLISMGYIQVIGSNLAEVGHNSIWDTIRASDLGAIQQRRRLWITSDPCSQGGARLESGADISSAGSGGAV